MNDSPLPRLSTDPRVQTLVGIPATRQPAALSEVEALHKALAVREGIEAALRAQLDSEMRYSAALALRNAYMADEAARARRAQVQLLESFGEMLAELGDPRLQAKFDAIARTIAQQSAESLSEVLKAQLLAHPGPEIPPVTDDPFAPVCTTVGFASGTEPCDRFEETVVQDEGGGR